MSELQPNRLAQSASPASMIVPILIGAVLAQMVASVYLLYQLNRVRDDVGRTRMELSQTDERLKMDIASVKELSAIASKQASQSTAETLETLRAQLDTARREARKTDGKKKEDADKHVADLEKQFAIVSEQLKEEDRKVTAVGDLASQAKTDSETVKTQVSQVKGEVGVVRTDLDATKADVDKHANELKSVKGELSAQSSLIATNRDELATLRAKGDREYFEFRALKDNTTRRAGPIQIRLKSTDPIKNRYTIDVTIDDKTIPRKDRAINEPLQFSTGRDQQYLELVVYEVAKNVIVGYVSAPKPRQTH